MPDARSQSVNSTQETAHPALTQVIRRHQATPHRRPINSTFRGLFAELDKLVSKHPGGVLIDSGCGTGDSSVALAHAQPDLLVLGIDKNPVRLKRAERRRHSSANLRFVRSNLPDLWAHARRAGWPIRSNLLLYPNPWPKPRHLMRRWHANPAMEDVVALGGQLELRTNWRLYAEEFARAVQLWRDLEARPSIWRPLEPLSAFERKYLLSGHTLFRVVVELSRDATR